MSNGKVVIIPVDPSEPVRTEDFPSSFLAYAYETIGCSVVECIEIAAGTDMWLDEEAGMYGAHQGIINQRATLLMRASYAAQGITGDTVPLLGTAVMAGTDGRGETVGIADSEAEAILSVMASLLTIMERSGSGGIR